jgi:AcrR family transcriptional regulator
MAGRRPGGTDTRAEIVTAARQAFTEEGYNQATLRGIARRAGVDPALVHHYFTDKPKLFVETVRFPADPQQEQQEAAAQQDLPTGERLVDRFLAQWEAGDGLGPASFVSVAQAMSASPQAASAICEFLDERMPLTGPADEDPELSRRRRALVSAQLFGIAWHRYVMQVEPLASATRAEVARWAGPGIDHCLSRSSLPG